MAAKLFVVVAAVCVTCAGLAAAFPYSPAPQPAYHQATVPAYHQATAPAAYHQATAPAAYHQAASAAAPEHEEEEEEHEPEHREPEHHHHHRSYHFQYAVHDPVTGDEHSQNEVNDGHGNVRGTYSLVEADGSTRVVEYTADDEHGFNAEVKKIEPQQHKAAPAAAAAAASAHEAYEHKAAATAYQPYEHKQPAPVHSAEEDLHQYVPVELYPSH